MTSWTRLLSEHPSKDILISINDYLCNSVLLENKNHKLIAVHQGKYYKRAEGLALGPGCFVKGLEFATGRTAKVIGKPNPYFFEGALAGRDPASCVMIGDVCKVRNTFWKLNEFLIHRMPMMTLWAPWAWACREFWSRPANICRMLNHPHLQQRCWKTLQRLSIGLYRKTNLRLYWASANMFIVFKT